MMSLWRRVADLVPNKRAGLARALGSLGVSALLERVLTSRGLTLVVFTHHRIAEPGVRANPFYDPVISASPRGFKEEVSFLHRYFQFVSIEQLRDLDALKSMVSRTRKLPALITFDDGYRDNFDCALPVLRQTGIPATFFIPASFLQQPRLPWWDHVAYVLKQTRKTALAVERCPGDTLPVTFELGSDPERIQAIKTVIDLFLNDELQDEAWFLDQLQLKAEVDVSAVNPGRDLFMNGDQLRELCAAGMSIGSHGHSHLALGRLDTDAQRRELVESKQTLERLLGCEVSAVAYPYGWPGTYNAQTQRLAREAGYRLGFTSLEGVNAFTSESLNPFALRRLNVGTGDSGTLLRARAALHGTLGRSFL